MTEDPIQQFLEEAARPTLERVRADRERVSERLRAPLAVLEKRLFDDDFDVNALWRESRVKSKHASEWFSAELGATPLVYLTDCRLRVGAALLVRTDLKLWEIAIALGYSGTEVFSRRFKNWGGLSPRGYRKNPEARSWAAEPAPTPQPAAQNEVTELFGKIVEASKAGDYAGAFTGVSRAQEILRDQALLRLAAEFALAVHELGAQRTLDGDVDQAYTDLKLAHDCYAVAQGRGSEISQGPDPPVSCDTGQVLLGALCRGCRQAFEDDGRLGRRLRSVLRPIPEDLEWFQHACDDCYRVVWDAVDRGRLGLVDDAWEALWLSQNVDPARAGLPPSRGLVIRLLVASERLTFQDPRERLVLCRQAVQAARQLGDPAVLAMAQIYEGNCLRALSRYTEGRESLNEAFHGAWDKALGAEWVAAAYHRDLGSLECDDENFDEAVPALEEAVARYSALDRHSAALCEFKLAEALYWSGRFDDALERLDASVEKMDLRRSAYPRAGVFTTRGLYLCALGRLGEAERELDQFQSDQPVLVADYQQVRGCLRMEQNEPIEALAHFQQAGEDYLTLGKVEDAAHAALSRAECHARKGDADSALLELSAATEYFSSARRPARILQGIQQLRELLNSAAAESLVGEIRRTAWQSGGCLPVTRRLRR